MKAEIEIINVLKYDSEKNGKGTRISYRMLGQQYLSKMKNLKGYQNLEVYYSGHDVFEEIPESFFGVKVIAEIVTDPNSSDPLRPRYTFKSLESNGITVNLM